jgi:HlyD family secretion protein
MKRLVPIAIVVAIAGTFVWTLLFLYRKSQADPVVFETESPVYMNLVKKTVATGAIVPRQEVEIKPRVSGIVDKLFVEAGAIVKEGDPLARIRIVPNVVSLNEAEAAVQAARITFNNASREVDRAEKLFGQNLLAAAELERARFDHELRKQELVAAEDNLQLVRSGASRKGGKVSNVVTSTMDGMVIQVGATGANAVVVKEGTSVTETNNFNAGTTIAVVANMNDMIFQGKVDESEVGKIKQGMELDIVIGAVDKRRFKGTLEYISPKGVEFEGAIQFEIRAAIVESPKDVFIRANYSANADIVLAKRDNVLTIREALLQFDKDGKPFVEVETGPQKFEKRAVEIGISDGLNVEIVRGLTKDEKVKKPEGIGDAEMGKNKTDRPRRR